MKLIVSSSELTFTPAEVEEVTGLTTTMQRDWRRRRFLKVQPQSHARFRTKEVAEILVMKLLADRGLGPASTRSFSRRAAESVLWYAYENSNAVATRGTSEEIAEYHRIFGQDLKEIERLIGTKTAGLCKYFVAFSDNDFVNSSDLDECFGRESIQPAVVLNLEAIGSHLVAKAGKPLVQIELRSKRASKR